MVSAVLGSSSRGALFGEVELAPGDLGAFAGLPELLGTKPFHRSVHALDANVEKGRVGIVDVPVDGTVGNPVGAPILNMVVVSCQPRFVVLGFDPNQDVLHRSIRPT